MKRTPFSLCHRAVILSTLLLAALAFSSCSSTSKYYVAAYVWPSCHDDSVAHKYLWPQGDGEWEVIRQGTPRFEGHYQPRQPLWGYEHDDDPKVVEKWIDTALAHGVNTFVYDWYWFLGGPYLEGALDDGFLGARNNRKMNFYIMWANHTVVRNYWNYHLYGDNEDILFDPDLTWDQFKKIVDRIIKQYFCQPNYVKFDGRPVMSIFSMDNLARGFGGLGQAGEAINYFREEVKKAGYPDLYLMENFGGGPWVTDEFKEHEAAKIKSGSAEPNRKKVASVTWDQVKTIAEDKMPDLNCFEVKSAMRMVAGTARSMGIAVKGEFPNE